VRFIKRRIRAAALTLFTSLTVSLALPFALSATAIVKGRLYWEKHGEGRVIYHVSVADRVVALTFDDGPEESYTPDILKILAHYRAHATFFVIGDRARTHPDLLRQIIGYGHEIGNHTLTHERKKSVTRQEIEECDALVHQATGIPPLYLRPPGGRMNERILELARTSHHIVVMWSVDARDWARPGAGRIASSVIGKVQPGDIVIFHDGGGKRAQTVTALKIILTRLSADGYRFLTMTELLREQLHHKVRQ
jgi:peptidoglycan/xylan/chitin deacetylase (PgdA/CDA1 family)